MKIELLSGGHVDTDQLTDRNAQIHEAFGNLYEVCKKYDVTVFSRVLLSEKDSIGMLYLPTGDETRSLEQYSFLVASLSEWINKTSKGRLQVTEVENYGGEIGPDV